jgi:hypothetical protein
MQWWRTQLISKMVVCANTKCAMMDAPRLVLFRFPQAVEETPEVSCERQPFQKWRNSVNDTVAPKYLGFENKGAVREYAFTVRGTDGVRSEYFVTIANDAFVAHRVRYQDAPEICSLRLHRELAARADHPSLTCFSVTDLELADYKNAHTPKTKPSTSAQRKDEGL